MLPCYPGFWAFVPLMVLNFFFWPMVFLSLLSGIFAHTGRPWGLAFHPGLPRSCPPAWRCHQANTFDLYILCFMNNLNQGAEEALDDNRARGANCKVNIALFRSHFFINPSCSNPGGTLNEKPREVPTSCAACRTWVILSTGEIWQWRKWIFAWRPKDLMPKN